jgi:SRSO17 transposase
MSAEVLERSSGPVRRGGVPDERGFATKPQLARRMILRCLPADWVAADEAFDMDCRFRRMLEELQVGYVLACPSLRTSRVADASRP